MHTCVAKLHLQNPSHRAIPRRKRVPHLLGMLLDQDKEAPWVRGQCEHCLEKEHHPGSCSWWQAAAPDGDEPPPAPGRLHWGGHREDVSSRRTQIVLARPLEGVSFLCFWKVPAPVERHEISREEAPRAAGGSETIHKAFLTVRVTLPTGPRSWRGAAFSQKHIITFPYLYAGGRPRASGGVLTEARESSSASPLSRLDTSPTARSPPSPPPGGPLATLGVPPSAREFGGDKDTLPLARRLVLVVKAVIAIETNLIYLACDFN